MLQALPPNSHPAAIRYIAAPLGGTGTLFA
jgi:hypothetical protein